jgi:hypothetical protein
MRGKVGARDGRGWVVSSLPQELSGKEARLGTDGGPARDETGGIDRLGVAVGEDTAGPNPCAFGRSVYRARLAATSKTRDTARSSLSDGGTTKRLPLGAALNTWC